MAGVGGILRKWDTFLVARVTGRARRASLHRIIRWISASADGHAYPAGSSVRQRIELLKGGSKVVTAKCLYGINAHGHQPQQQGQVDQAQSS